MKGGYLELLITHNPGTMLVKGALLKDQVQNAKRLVLPESWFGIAT